MSVLDEAVKRVRFIKSLPTSRVRNGKQASTDRGEDGPRASQNPSSSKRLTNCCSNLGTSKALLKNDQGACHLKGNNRQQSLSAGRSGLSCENEKSGQMSGPPWASHSSRHLEGLPGDTVW